MSGEKGQVESLDALHTEASVVLQLLEQGWHVGEDTVERLARCVLAIEQVGVAFWIEGWDGGEWVTVADGGGYAAGENLSDGDPLFTIRGGHFGGYRS